MKPLVVLEQIAKSTEATLVRIESRLDRLADVHDRNFRLTFGAIITASVSLAGMMARHFKWLF